MIFDISIKEGAASLLGYRWKYASRPHHNLSCCPVVGDEPCCKEEEFSVKLLLSPELRLGRGEDGLTIGVGVRANLSVGAGSAAVWARSPQ